MVKELLEAIAIDVRGDEYSTVALSISGFG